MYEFAKPANGSEFSPAELEALWGIKVPSSAVLLGPLELRWRLFRHRVFDPSNLYTKRDEHWFNVLTRALLAEDENPVPVMRGYDIDPA